MEADSAYVPGALAVLHILHARRLLQEGRLPVAEDPLLNISQGGPLMRQLNLHCNRKFRGRKRRMRALQRWMSSFEGRFPEPDTARESWYTKLPVHEAMIDGQRVRFGIRRAVVGAMLDVVQSLQCANPRADDHSGVVACVTLPDLFSSSIDVFFTDDAYDTFVTRPGLDGQWEGQCWTPLPAARSLQAEWQLPTRLPERGYHVEIHEAWDDEAYHYSGEI